MLNILDITLEILHLSIIITIVFGWYFRKTRRLNLLIIMVTSVSWFGFGWFYGMGYCFLTDYHFQIKRELGASDLPISYIKYIVDRSFSVDSNTSIIDIITMTTFIISSLLSIILNIEDYYKKSRDG